jgi:hypothetical protein
VERKSERADTAYLPRVREEELSAIADREAGGGAKVRASGYGVFAEVPRGEAFGHCQRSALYDIICGTHFSL